MGDKKRFDVNARVLIKNPGVVGVVTETADTPTVSGEYWHKIRTDHGEQDEPGCNLERIPEAQK
jgi:hypothetical protein